MGSGRQGMEKEGHSPGGDRRRHRGVNAGGVFPGKELTRLARGFSVKGGAPGCTRGRLNRLIDARTLLSLWGLYMQKVTDILPQSTPCLVQEKTVHFDHGFSSGKSRSCTIKHNIKNS